MTLQSYLADAGRGSAIRLARELGVAPVMVAQWASGKKEVAIARASDIERATEGAVRRWDLRPGDWHRIWPELVHVPGAPAVPILSQAA